MKYNLNDKFLLEGVEAKVSFISASGNAYLTPINEGDFYDFSPIFPFIVFAVIDSNGRDVKTKKKALTINNSNCGAV